jgi:hypothetical protein
MAASSAQVAGRDIEALADPRICVMVQLIVQQKK